MKISKAQIVLAFVTLAAIVFIFANSAQPAEISNGASTEVLDDLLAFFASYGIHLGLTQHVLRKMAHFVEFFTLGCLLIATTRAFTPYMFRHVFVALFIGLLVPVMDETIQIFMPGRSAQVSDVLLDFSGVLSGFAITFLIIYLLAHRRRKHTR